MDNLELQRENRLDENALAQMGAKQGITASEWLETLKARRYIALRYAMDEPTPVARDERVGVHEREKQRELADRQLALVAKLTSRGLSWKDLASLSMNSWSTR